MTFKDRCLILINYTDEEVEKLSQLSKQLQGVEVNHAIELFTEYVEKYITKKHETTWTCTTNCQIVSVKGIE